MSTPVYKYIPCKCSSCGWKDEFREDAIKDTDCVAGWCDTCHTGRIFNVVKPANYTPEELEPWYIKKIKELEDKVEEQGLTLVTLSYMILGENPKDKSDRALFHRAQEILNDSVSLGAWHSAFGTSQLTHALAGVEALERKASKLMAHVTADAWCPCCEGIEKCVPGCTISSDCRDVWERMSTAREALNL